MMETEKNSDDVGGGDCVGCDEKVIFESSARHFSDDTIGSDSDKK